MRTQKTSLSYKRNSKKPPSSYKLHRRKTWEWPIGNYFYLSLIYMVWSQYYGVVILHFSLQTLKKWKATILDYLERNNVFLSREIFSILLIQTRIQSHLFYPTNNLGKGIQIITYIKRYKYPTNIYIPLHKIYHRKHLILGNTYA